MSKKKKKSKYDSNLKIYRYINELLSIAKPSTEIMKIQEVRINNISTCIIIPKL